jgi:hypothetical protein
MSIAAISAVYCAYRIGYLDGRASCGYPCVPGHQDFSYDIMRLKIGVALLVLAIALWFRKLLWLCISAVAAVFIEVQYGLWYLDTQRWLREMGVKDFSNLPVPSEFPHFIGLYRATPWDLMLLIFTTTFLIWEVRILIAIITRAHQHK